jgi:hypothetical protein
MADTAKKRSQADTAIGNMTGRQCPILPLKIVLRLAHEIEDLGDGPEYKFV